MEIETKSIVSATTLSFLQSVKETSENVLSLLIMPIHRREFLDQICPELVDQKLIEVIKINFNVDKKEVSKFLILSEELNDNDSADSYNKKQEVAVEEAEMILASETSGLRIRNCKISLDGYVLIVYFNAR